MKVMKLHVLAFLMLAIAGTADAQSAREMRKQVEASMLVTGHVDIDREGRVTAHSLDQSEQMPPYVADFIGRAVPLLRFEPIVLDGEPILARAQMTLRLVAEPVGDEMQIGIRSAHFGEKQSGADTDQVRGDGLKPPWYPSEVLRMGGKGTVYLIVKVARDGSAEDVVVEQTNLSTVGTARQMATVRAALEDSAMEAAREWTFIPPTTGDLAADPYWTVRVPVSFNLDDDRRTRYGEWVGYHPGPRTRPDWLEDDAPGFSPDLLTAGGIHPAQSRFRLITPLGG